jgi:antitoxin component YwqK of YwqJK toxin-antitoxin module
MTITMRVPFDNLTVMDDQSLTYQGSLFTGIAYETNDRGVVRSESNYENGLQNGVTREWDDSGQLRAESHFYQGSKHGYSRRWSDSGLLESEAEYKYSIKVREKAWDRQGAIIKDWTLPENDDKHRLIELLAKRFGH